MHITKHVAGLTLAAGTILGTSLLAAPAAQAAPRCPSGAVCIVETNETTILAKNIFYSYGAHNLSNVTGRRILINSQTGGAGFQVCLNYGGTNCSPVVRGTGTYTPYDMTPINSIRLVR